MGEKLNNIKQSDQLSFYQHKTKRLEKKLARIEQARKLRLQKLMGVICIISALITIFYLDDITTSIVAIPCGIGLILAKNIYVEF